MFEDKLTKDLAEAAKKVMQTEVEEPKAKGEKDFKAAHKVKIKEPLIKMSEGKMKELHALVSKGIKDPKKITKELGLPNTKEVHKAIASLVAGMKEGLDAVNKDAVKKKFKDRKDKDIDNDGDVDDSDEYLHKRRKAISKATSEGKKKLTASCESFTNFDPTPSELDEACDYILENGSISDLSDEQLDEVLATVAKGIGKAAGAAGKLAFKGAKKVADRLSTKGRADAAAKKADKMDQKAADRERLQRAKMRIQARKEKDKEEKEKTKRAKQRVQNMKKKEAEEKRERKAREQEAAKKKQQSESLGDNKGAILRHQDLAMKAHKKGDKEAVKFHQDKIKKLRTQKESTQIEEKNDALYLIYKDKIKAMKVNNYIKKTYRGKAESEFAPMDAKNFGVSVFADRMADKIQKDVTKKFGKPDDFMLEQV